MNETKKLTEDLRTKRTEEGKVSSWRPRTASDIMRSLALLLVGLAILFVYLSTFVDRELILSAIASVDPFMFALALLCSFLGLLWYAFSWDLLLRRLGHRPGFLYTSTLAIAATFLNILIPSGSISGGAFRIAMIARNPDIPIEDGISTLIADRVICFFPFLLGALLGTSFSWLTGELRGGILLLLGAILLGSAAGLALLVLLVYRTEGCVRTIIKILAFFKRPIKSGRTREWLDHLEFRLEEGTQRLDKAMREMRDPRGLAAPSAAALAYWFFDSLVMYFILLGMGAEAPIHLVIFVYTLTVMVQTFPVGIPGMLGVVDVIRTELFGAAGLIREVALGASLLADFVMVVFVILVGLVALTIFNLKFPGRGVKEGEYR